MTTVLASTSGFDFLDDDMDNGSPKIEMPIIDDFEDIFGEFIDELSTQVVDPEHEKARRQGRAEVSISAELLRKYFKNRSPVTDIIESYDDWLDHGLKQDMRGHFIELVKIYDSKPTTVRAYIVQSGYKSPAISSINRADGSATSSSAPMYPSYAKLHRVDYNIKVMGCVIFEVLDESQKQWIVKETSDITELFSLPCMVKSRYCNTTDSSLTAEQLFTLGEDPKDPGAYFIVEGHSRFMPYVDNLSKDQIAVLPPDLEKKMVHNYVKQTVLTATATAQNQIIIDNHNVMLFQSTVFKLKNDDNKAINSGKIANSVNILHVISLLITYPSLNVAANPISAALIRELNGTAQSKYQDFTINRTMMHDDNNNNNYKNKVVQLFKWFLLKLTPKEYPKILLIMSNTITNFLNTKFHTVISDIMKWLNITTLNGSEVVKHLNFICSNDIFPNVNANRVDDKLWMMAIMASQLACVETGLFSVSSRDNWSAKTLLPAGGHLSKLYKPIWSGTIKALREELMKNPNSADIKPDGFFKSHFKGVKITKDIMSHLKNTKAPSKNAKSKENPVAELLEIGGPVKPLTLMTKISSNINSNNKSLRLRGLQPSAPPYVCPVTTPENKDCGTTKFKAITCNVTTWKDFGPYLMQLRREGKVVERTIRGFPEDKTAPILVNGVYMGWCNPTTLYADLVQKRRTHKIPYDVTFFHSHKNYFEIYTNAGRMIHPVLVVENGKVKIDVDNVRHLSFEALVQGGYIEYLSPGEEEYLLVAADLETLDIYRTTLESPETSEEDRKKLERNPYQYCNIHPVAMFAVSASLGRYTNHNASCRATFQSKMTKQALSLPIVNTHMADISTPYVTQPLVDTALSREMSRYPSGDTLIIAFMAKYKTQEDAIEFNKRAIDMGKFRHTRTRVYTAVLSTNDKHPQVLKRPELNKGSRVVDRHSALTRDGLPAIGAYIKEDHSVIGIVETRTPKPGFPKEEHDKSIFLGIGESGYVHDVVVRTIEGKPKISVTLMETKTLAIGDKITSGYAQKVTVGVISDDRDMPFIAQGPNAGMRPDAIVNPHCIPSRMTIGFMFELLVGKAAIANSEFYDATAFEPFEYTKFCEYLKRRGFHPKGSELMRDGKTGKLIKCWIYMGPVFYHLLPHIAADKLQGRGGGGIRDQFTRQATSGRQHGGGVKCGEMEFDELRANMAAEIVLERGTIHADRFEAVVCEDCGSISSFNTSVKKFTCPICPNGNMGKVDIPYIFKLIQQLNMSIGVRLSLKVTTYDKFLAEMEEKRNRQFIISNAEDVLDFSQNSDDEEGVWDE